MKQNFSPLKNALNDFFEKNGSLLKPGAKILVACSGGPDSVGLVHALYLLEGEFPYRYLLGHVNHLLRGKASLRDERLVRELGRKLRWRVLSQKGPINKEKGNLEERAREKRYEALYRLAKKAGCQAIFTAHTLDDQVETILINLFRGTAVDGLGGIQPLRKIESNKSKKQFKNHIAGRSGENIFLGRPFLSVLKKDILHFLKTSKVPYRIDESNQNPKFLRNWIHHNVVPMIEKRVPGFKDRLLRLSEVVRGEQEYWTWMLTKMEQQFLRPYRRGVLLDFDRVISYPPAAQRRFLRRVVGQDLLTFEGVEGLRCWMSSPPSSGRVWQLRKGWIAERLSKTQGSPTPRFFWFRHFKKTP